MVKGAGISAMKDFRIIDRLRAATEDKKRFEQERAREADINEVLGLQLIEQNERQRASMLRKQAARARGISPFADHLLNDLLE